MFIIYSLSFVNNSAAADCSEKTIGSYMHPKTKEDDIMMMT